MTLGEHPEKVPPQYLIPTELFRSTADVGRFENVASSSRAGRPRAQTWRAGVSSTISMATTCPTSSRRRSMPSWVRRCYINRGDGTFEDRSAAAGLGDQVYALNVTRTDFDNDGDLDVLLLRGAWEKPLRLSLLRNEGDGDFDDVTVASGLAEPIATESAAWGDYDNDGLVDVFVCGEYLPPGGAASSASRATPAIAAGCITIRATARSRTSRRRPASPTSAAPRARLG